MLAIKFISYLLWPVLITAGAAKHRIFLVRIYSGKDTSIRRFPYHVALEHNGEYLCGGAIVSRRNVLTAAHCFDGVDPTKLTVRSGTPFIEREGIIHKVQNFTRHPDFQLNLFRNAHNDIAVIRLIEPFIYDLRHHKIQLFNYNEQVKGGDTAIVTGWGGTENCEFADRFRYVRVPVVNKTDCDNSYRPFGGIGEGEICAGIVGKGSWHGDSGGPLAIGERLAGVVSYGEGCKAPEYPGVFSEIGFYRDWIDRYVEYDPR